MSFHVILKRDEQDVDFKVDANVHQLMGSSSRYLNVFS